MQATARSPGTPEHVAIIMDGNGRWAQRRGLPRIAGHHKGAEAVREICAGAVELGVGYLTLFGFSSENWRRPASEVGDLMNLLRRYLRTELAELHRRDIRFRMVGAREGLDADIVALIDKAEHTTQANRSLTLALAINYGGRADIARAARNIAESIRLGLITPDAVDEERFSGYLATAGLPPPDLLIRTGGERRLSNFLLYELAYTELVFLDVFWPEFSKSHLARALEDYRGRERRFGRVAGGMAG